MKNILLALLFSVSLNAQQVVSFSSDHFEVYFFKIFKPEVLPGTLTSSWVMPDGYWASIIFKGAPACEYYAVDTKLTDGKVRSDVAKPVAQYLSDVRWVSGIVVPTDAKPESVEIKCLSVTQTEQLKPL